MALSLTEAAKLSQDQVRRGVIESVVVNSLLLDKLPFITVSGNSYAYIRENALGGAAFRAVNSGYTPTSGTYTKEHADLTRLGAISDLDKFIAETVEGTVEDQRAAELAGHSKSVQLEFHDAFINGDGDDDVFAGIETAITSGQEVHADAETGLKITGTSSEDRYTFFESVNELLSKVVGGADLLIMNSQVLFKFQSAAQRESMWVAGTDNFGNPIGFYNSIPLFDIGNNSAGSPIIAQNENYGTADEGVYPVTNASTIYAVRFGTDAVAGIQGSKGVDVIDVGLITEDGKPAYRHLIEWHCGLAVHNPTSVAALRGVVIA